MQTGIATKTNLIRAQSFLKLCQEGYELLDKKRNVLVLSMMSYIDKADEVQTKVVKVFDEAYEALQTANITTGFDNVWQIAQSVPEASGYEILTKSIMGVEIPRVVFTEEKPEPYYSFFHTNTTLDTALSKFYQVRLLLFELSQIEDSVYKLAMEVKKTQKRVNALKNIQIPKYRHMVKSISETLEEKEREDFFRLKVVKKKK